MEERTGAGGAAPDRRWAADLGLAGVTRNGPRKRGADPVGALGLV